jgi:hypothetical protein
MKKLNNLKIKLKDFRTFGREYKIRRMKRKRRIRRRV